MARLNDTEALVARPFEPGDSHSITTRKVDNGFVTCVTTYDARTQQCKTAETFSKNPPRIVAPRVDGRSSERSGAVGPEGLGTTKAYLGKDV